MSSDRTITATMLRDIVVCERRAHHDLYTDPDGRDPVSSFVEMLWAGGSAHERVVLGALSGSVVNLREMSVSERPEATRAALRGEADHVLGAVLLDQDLEGRPDIISRIDGEWVCGDVKSGTPFMPVQGGDKAGHWTAGDVLSGAE